MSPSRGVGPSGSPSARRSAAGRAVPSTLTLLDTNTSPTRRSVSSSKMELMEANDEGRSSVSGVGLSRSEVGAGSGKRLDRPKPTLAPGVFTTQATTSTTQPPPAGAAGASVRSASAAVGQRRFVVGYNNPRRASAPQPQLLPQASAPLDPRAMAATTRYLLTVIPPEHLPHDPPHPRTNPQCSGYGPPKHFRYALSLIAPSS